MRIEEAPDALETFDSKTRAIPGEIASAETAPGAQIPAAPPVDPRIRYLWTPEEVAEQFAALFVVAEVSRGPHWSVDEAGLSKLGQKFCPIFQRYVPNTGDTVPWLSEAMMWIGALGALKEVVGPALKEEKRLALEKQRKARALSQASTRMGTSVETLPSSESEGPESRTSWSAS